MSAEGMASLRRSVDEVKQVLGVIDEGQAQLPSGCEGWRVQDLVAHMSSNYKETVAPSPPPSEPLALPAEALMEVLVDPRKGWTWAQVRDEYLAYADQAVAALAALQDEPLASTVVPLADLGQYPMHQLADAYAFDHYCHLRIDLLPPRGPIAVTLSEPDDELMGPVVGWMLAGLPQMQPGLVADLVAPVRLTLTGPGGGSWVVVAAEEGAGPEFAVIEGAEAEPAAAEVTSTTHDFVLWGTQRRSWRELGAVQGDEVVAARFLDALNIV